MRLANEIHDTGRRSSGRATANWPSSTTAALRLRLALGAARALGLPATHRGWSRRASPGATKSAAGRSPRGAGLRRGKEVDVRPDPPRASARARRYVPRSGAIRARQLDRVGAVGLARRLLASLQLSYFGGGWGGSGSVPRRRMYSAQPAGYETMSRPRSRASCFHGVEQRAVVRDDERRVPETLRGRPQAPRGSRDRGGSSARRARGSSRPWRRRARARAGAARRPKGRDALLVSFPAREEEAPEERLRLGPVQPGRGDRGVEHRAALVELDLVLREVRRPRRRGRR